MKVCFFFFRHVWRISQECCLRDELLVCLFVLASDITNCRDQLLIGSWSRSVFVRRRTSNDTWKFSACTTYIGIMHRKVSETSPKQYNPVKAAYSCIRFWFTKKVKETEQQADISDTFFSQVCPISMSWIVSVINLIVYFHSLFLTFLSSAFARTTSDNRHSIKISKIY